MLKSSSISLQSTEVDIIYYVSVITDVFMVVGLRFNIILVRMEFVMICEDAFFPSFTHTRKSLDMRKKLFHLLSSAADFQTLRVNKYLKIIWHTNVLRQISIPTGDKE